MNTLLGGDFGQTTKHIYNITDKIGTGASCYVFKGVERGSGQTRALKIFKDAAWNRSVEKQREIVALTRLTHRNIIGYYGKETESVTGRGVLVMEYCSGGSLLTYLQLPENIHGLRDSEFFSFISDTCKGWKYLRQCGFVHRDIKPGNILRHVELDGSVVYKLADFGASKSVANNGGEFMSLAGTEEYLHPAMYEQAFILPNGQSVFTESVDMWSFGVTTYHACTGEIPFKPFGGSRKNRGAMYMMITRKPPGTIAGEQLTPSADSIHWKRKLPETCPLSPSIQEKAEEIISGLVEANPGRQWTFTTLEDSVHKLVNLRRVSVVSSDEATLHTVYISHKASVQELQEAVAVATEVPASRQMFVFENEVLENPDVNPCAGTSVFEKDEDDEVLTLVNRGESEDVRGLPSIGRPPSFSSSPGVEGDVKTAVRLCSYMYLLLLQVLESVRVQHAQSRANQCLLSYLKNVLYKVEKKFKVLSETCQEKQSRLEAIKDMESTRKQIARQQNQHITSSTNTARRILNKLHKQLWDIKSELTSIREMVHSQGRQQGLNSHTSSGQYKRHRIIQGSFDEAKSILKRMSPRIQRQPLPDCENIVHDRDRKELAELCQSCKSHWQNHFLNTHRPAQLTFRERKTTYLRHLERLRHIESILDEVTRGRNDLSQVLTEASAFSGRAWKDVVTKISTLFKK